MTRKELEKFFEKNYGYNKTSIWNINGLTVDANNIDEEVTKKLDRELKGRDKFGYGEEIFKNSVVMTKRGENYFIKVELENEEALIINNNGDLVPYLQYGNKQAYDLICNIQGYWHEGNVIDLKCKYKYKSYVYRQDKTLKWENYSFENIVKIVNETVDMYFIEEVLGKVIKYDMLW